ncbi:MAG: glucosamine 6-phosphate synthetase [Deltaproteobacteria bacterium]|nr:MAG: glucosamine 6-phosphate synthetase [Deltaproteobacteria bacterium]
MCGIFGLSVHKGSGYGPAFIKKALATLASLSESRGKDSSGLVFRNESEGELQVFKGAVPLSYLLSRKELTHQVDRMIGSTKLERPAGKQSTFAVMGHSRLVTNGSQLNDENNQPVVKDGVIGIHNGIIVNETELWSRYPEIQRTYEIDTEVMLALIRKYLRDGGDIAAAVSKTVTEIFGTVAAAFLMVDLNLLAVATNNGSLYVLTDDAGLFAFASEEYFLKKLAQVMRLGRNGKNCIRQVVPGTGFVLGLDNFRLQEFSFSTGPNGPIGNSVTTAPYKIMVQSISDGKPQRELILDPAKIAVHPKALTESALLEFNLERIKALRRCSKCLLPETFPFIEYDEAGVCNYCNNYRIKNEPKPIEELFELVEPYRRSDGSPDCIIPYSGGRDSTYTLHIARNILKLNPIAFTYDWGMVNDLARRNIARVCGKLGVENILVSADIAWKRENIRKNILAWLRKPHLGIVPLFMAGDKFFFYYTDQVKRQTGIRLNIWGINPLENTDFKVGFLGVPPDHNKKRIYSLSLKRQAMLFRGVGKIILENPRYLNGSVWDTLGSFVSRSIIPHRDYYHLFDYYRWDEKEIEKLVLEEYQWETAVDTKTTWRIGDGTAPLYNYIYYTVAGFSEYDTFRSNQIREGMLSREEGLRYVMEENRPRYASIKWYTDILNLDFPSTVKRINDIPKLYS